MSDNKNIHICLVSAQILANLIPVLMDKPEKVILISTKTMMKNGLTKRFQDILQKEKITYDVFEEMPSTNMVDIYNFALETSELIQEKYPDSILTLNATNKSCTYITYASSSVPNPSIFSYPFIAMRFKIQL